MREMETKKCEECKYFYQHYGKDADLGYHKLYCGHCIGNRGPRKNFPKNTKPNSKACQSFEQIDENDIRKEKKETIMSVMDCVNEKLKRLLEYLG